MLFDVESMKKAMLEFEVGGASGASEYIVM